MQRKRRPSRGDKYILYVSPHRLSDVILDKYIRLNSQRKTGVDILREAVIEHLLTHGSEEMKSALRQALDLEAQWRSEDEGSSA